MSHENYTIQCSVYKAEVLVDTFALFVAHKKCTVMSITLIDDFIYECWQLFQRLQQNDSGQITDYILCIIYLQQHRMQHALAALLFRFSFDVWKPIQPDWLTIHYII